MKKIHFLLLLLLLIFISCSKSNDELLCKQDQLIDAPPEFLQYWYFPKGSYWIYKLQDTVGVYDTMRVTVDYKRYCKGDDPHNPDCDQGNCVWMYSNTWKHSDTTFFYSKPNYPANHYTTSYYFGTYWAVAGAGGGGTYAPTYPFKYPFTIGEKYMGNNEIVSEDNVQTPAGIFAHTLHIIPDRFQLDSNINKYVQHLYITPKVGIIKWHYTHNKIWELVEYDVTP